MNPLSKLAVQDDIKKGGDSLGGNYVLDSDVYDAVIESAYLDLSSGGAYGLVVDFKIEDKNLKHTFWLTSGKEKGQLNYFVNKKGEKQYLPGFEQGNALALLTTGKNIGELTTETKVLKVYNPTLKKEAPTEKEVFIEMIGKPIKVGVIKQIVNKKEKDASGNYVPTGETREENVIDKLFHYETGLTISEAEAGEEEGTFIHKWIEKNKGKVKDKTNKNKGVGDSGTAGSPTKKKKSLFGSAA